MKSKGIKSNYLTSKAITRKVMRSVLLLLLYASSVAFPASAFADKAVFAGGCFWCMEKDFESLEGVSEAISGFTGGTAANPTYRGDHTGHYEAVEITYDPNIVSYQELLDHFWVNVDPFGARGQFCDKGPSYLSAVFVANDEEKALAEQSRQAVVDQFPDQTVVTPILPAAQFFPIKGDEIYKAYRWGCGRDKRLKAIWGDRATVK